jgi:hypothetical protein
MTTYAPQPARPSGARPRRLWPVIAGIVAAVLVAGFGGWLIGDAGCKPDGGPPADAPASSTGGLGAPHGPKVIRNGVPSGYTQDQAGAANAAVNAVQVQTAVAHGNADGAETAATWIAATADAHARAALSVATGAPSDDQTSKTPVTTRVTSFTGSAATVEVWIVAVGSSAGIGGGVTTSQNWSTQTYTLTWEKGDWKVVSFRTKNGPQPGDGQSSTGASVPPLTNGLYTVFIN